MVFMVLVYGMNSNIYLGIYDILMILYIFNLVYFVLMSKEEYFVMFKYVIIQKVYFIVIRILMMMFEMGIEDIMDYFLLNKYQVV